MDTINQRDQDKKLRKYSQVDSFNRLSDRDSETSSSLTAGGDKSNNKDTNPITDFASTFISDPKVVKNPADYGNYDGVDLTELDDLLND